MNTVSLFIYAADVVDGLSGTFGFFALVVGFASLIFFGRGMSALYDGFSRDKDSELGKTFIRISKWSLAVSILLTLFAIFLPSKDALYLIAGSEVGEVVVTSPEAKEIMGEVYNILRQELKEMQVQK